MAYQPKIEIPSPLHPGNAMLYQLYPIIIYHYLIILCYSMLHPQDPNFC